ncbi:GRIP domain containing protein, putative, partial [Leishmania shawi]
EAGAGGQGSGARAAEASLVDWKEKVKASKAQDAQRIASLEEELEQLRRQVAAGADEQVQAHEALRAELAVARQERDDAAQQAQQHAEDTTRVRQVLEAKVAELEQLEASLVDWKEKVKAAKLKDFERIGTLSEEVEGWRRESLRVSEVVLALCDCTRSCDDAASATKWSKSLCDAVKDCHEALGKASLEVGLKDTGAGMKALLQHCVVSLHDRAAAVNDSALRVEVLESEVLRLKELESSWSTRCENAEAHAKDVEEELRRASNQAERVSELEQESSELKARCDLLRKELQRQREAVQRDRSRPYEPANSEAGAPSIMKSQSAVQSALLAAAGCVSERDVATAIGARSAKYEFLKPGKTGADELIKENDKLRQENAHNNAVIAQYIQELEGYKANQRVQVSIEYLRNIVQQYLCAAEDLRPKMIPAICTVLEFNNRQKEDVQLANPRCPRFH